MSLKKSTFNLGILIGSCRGNLLEFTPNVKLRNLKSLLLRSKWRSLPPTKKRMVSTIIGGLWSTSIALFCLSVLLLNRLSIWLKNIPIGKKIALLLNRPMTLRFSPSERQRLLQILRTLPPDQRPKLRIEHTNELIRPIPKLRRH